MRLPRWMAALAIVGSVAFLTIGGRRAALGFALGAGLAILGFYWLHQAVVAMLDMNPGRFPKAVVGKMLVRYPLAIGVIGVFYRTHWLPFEAVLAGLFVPVAGAMAESFFLLGKMLRETPSSPP